MISVDISSLVDDKASELLGRPAAHGWAACASVWARVYVLASPGWARWPHLHQPVTMALSAALARCTGLDPAVPPEVEELTDFELEDDGSPEWQYVLDIVTMVLTALEDDDLATCVSSTLTTYLEQSFTLLANDLAEQDGRPISQADADARLAVDDRWRQVVDFVHAL
jgi:hypothetical protein